MKGLYWQLSIENAFNKYCRLMKLFSLALSGAWTCVTSRFIEAVSDTLRSTATLAVD
jgi:hypothetical protein